eukprot:Sdes_comp20370_c0_seq1m14198
MGKETGFRWLRFSDLVFIFIFLVSLGTAICQDQHYPVAKRSSQQILVCTLTGQLYAFDGLNGEQIWKFDAPQVEPTGGGFHSKHSTYIVEPRDGSIYRYAEGSSLVKLPITIPRLVQASPFQASDGSIYVGTKSTSIFLLDKRTGKFIKEYKTQLSTDCPNLTPDLPDVVLFGKTIYNVKVYEFSTGKEVNSFQYTEFVAPSQFGQRPGGKEDQNILVTSSPSSIAFRDSISGKSLWINKLDSTPVAVFHADEGRGIVKLTMVPISETEQIAGDVILSHPSTQRLKIVSGVEILENSDELFALTTYSNIFSSYESNSLLEAVKSDVILHSSSELSGEIISPNQTPCLPHSSQFPACLAGSIVSEFPTSLLNHQNIWRPTPMFHHTVPSTVFYASVILCAILLLNRYLSSASRKSSIEIEPSIKRTSQEDPTDFSSSNHNLSKDTMTDIEEIESSTMINSNVFIIGKLSINQNDIIGHGSHGTVVFKGEFEGRPVAVKRLLSQFFDDAIHESNLLQFSDDHSNVVRYFCREIDGQFMYLGLELCKSSLADFTKNPQNNFNRKEILYQIVSGLKHLHDSNIVHRDLKPHNVLITYKDKAVISDFGLCKRLLEGQNSFETLRSGTSGWVAPEVLWNDARITKSIDIFSAGC